MMPVVTVPGRGELRRCVCGRRPRLLRCYWMRPREMWNVHCPNGHCARMIEPEDAATRRDAIERWNAGHTRYNETTRATAAARDAAMAEIDRQIAAERRVTGRGA